MPLAMSLSVLVLRPLMIVHLTVFLFFLQTLEDSLVSSSIPNGIANERRKHNVEFAKYSA